MDVPGHLISDTHERINDDWQLTPDHFAFSCSGEIDNESLLCLVLTPGAVFTGIDHPPRVPCVDQKDERVSQLLPLP